MLFKYQEKVFHTKYILLAALFNVTTALAQPPESPTKSTQHVLIKKFQFQGNCHIDSDKLQKVLEKFRNRRLTQKELLSAVNKISTYYHNNGYFATRAYLSPEAVSHETAHIMVIEGHLEKNGITITNSGKRTNPNHIFNTFNDILPPEEVFTSARLERAILLVNDTPGVESSTILYPGDEVGGGKLNIDIYDTPLIHGNVLANDYGYEPTGRYQGAGTVFVDNLLGYGSQLTLQGARSNSGNHVSYLYAGYSLPLTDNGLRTGLTTSNTKYSVGSILAAEPGSRGTMLTTGAFLEYKYIRKRSGNLFLLGRVAHDQLHDVNVYTDLLIDKRTLNYMSISALGDWSDTLLFGGGGVNTFNINATPGRLNLNGVEPYATTDALTAKTEGNYAILNASASRLQSLVGYFSSFWYINSQFSNKNLDPSQQISLGGPYAVVGYPVGEALGDQGLTLHGDIRYDFYNMPWKGDFQITGMYTAGWIQLHKNTWEGWNEENPSLNNNYMLQSVGVSLSQNWDNKGNIEFIVGRRIGNNPGNVTTDFTVNMPGPLKKCQFWLQAITYF